MTTIDTEHNANLDFLPPAGDSRWWRVLTNPKSQTKPIRVQLMESYSPGKKAMSRVLNEEATIARKEDLFTAAETILIRIANYKTFLGDYGLAP